VVSEDEKEREQYEQKFVRKATLTVEMKHTQDLKRHIENCTCMVRWSR
jgi:hypothetical protein